MTSATSRIISRLGVGTYRMMLGVPEHERSLYRALERQKDPRLNINLIDTSSNYGNGRSEKLIGKVLANPRPNTLSREEVVIATKFGYIQNENMRLLSEGVFENVPFEEIVQYSPECYHCIHPAFMRDQLTRSLERLQTKYVDILFVHNPEYYLMKEVKNSEANIKKHQGVLLSRLSALFEELEREIDRGRIRAYGISSNSFALKPSHGHFLPYQDLVNMAQRAYEHVRATRPVSVLGSVAKAPSEAPKITLPPSPKSSDFFTASDHHRQHRQQSSSSPSSPKKQSTENPALSRLGHGLGFLQMPGNLLEMEGVETSAVWARGKGLRVFINRPLNAMSPETGACRLASYSAPHGALDYKKVLKEVDEMLREQGIKREVLQPKMDRLRAMLQQLNHMLHAGDSKLSIMELEGGQIQAALHQELARPVKFKQSKQPPHDEAEEGMALPSSQEEELSAADTPLETAVPPADRAKAKAKHKTVPEQEHERELHHPPTPANIASATPEHHHGHHHHPHAHQQRQPHSTPSFPSSTSAATAKSGRPSTEEMDNLLKGIDHFLEAFQQQVRFLESKRVEQMLTDRGVDLEGDTIEKFAIEYLLEHDQAVDSVLLGMKRERYVDFAREVLKEFLPAETQPQQQQQQQQQQQEQQQQEHQ
ncbi:hypothetical protein BGZ73_002703 [Actinomortierella ambigua]|nr:hypothetical protein BGZ73_002703 [Actinomortierella ambigua]